VVEVVISPIIVVLDVDVVDVEDVVLGSTGGC
jgi:hypothetical protein